MIKTRVAEKKYLFFLIVFLGILMLSGCAAGPNSAKGSPSEDGHVAGFWLGVWHGTIVPVTLIISFFTDSVRIYEVHNNGGWYDYGFVLGAAITYIYTTRIPLLLRSRNRKGRVKIARKN